MKTTKDKFETCPISTAQTIIGGKWTLSILFHLRTGVLRFGELNRRLPDVTQSTLTKELRGLEGYQLIKRKVYAEVPPRVEYSLTEIAIKLLPVLEELAKWSGEYNQYVKNNKGE